jgi:hypothetical protein
MSRRYTRRRRVSRRGGGFKNIIKRTAKACKGMFCMGEDAIRVNDVAHGVRAVNDLPQIVQNRNAAQQILNAPVVHNANNAAPVVHNANNAAGVGLLPREQAPAVAPAPKPRRREAQGNLRWLRPNQILNQPRRAPAVVPAAPAPANNRSKTRSGKYYGKR